MTYEIRAWVPPVLQAAIGLAVGGIGIQLFIPLLREVDPLGLTPIALISGAGGAALGWYLRGCESRRTHGQEV